MAKTSAKAGKKTATKKPETRPLGGKPKIRPLGEKILLQRLEAEQTTSGGIVLPDSAQEKPQRGTVLAIGDGKILDDGSRGEFQVSVGDVVLFASYAGTEIKVGTEDYMLMDESDVLAILD